MGERKTQFQKRHKSFNKAYMEIAQQIIKGAHAMGKYCTVHSRDVARKHYCWNYFNECGGDLFIFETQYVTSGGRVQISRNENHEPVDLSATCLKVRPHEEHYDSLIQMKVRNHGFFSSGNLQPFEKKREVKNLLNELTAAGIFLRHSSPVRQPQHEQFEEGGFEEEILILLR
ncbi:hypothetical protein JOB18_027558 [Solea senegalensis]|uniref:Uncharacterized protein n=1 Tax=Solea senegalensis TaxID=28829 RepID=A0AAV6REV6_SOLSE|nr:hypothetical protein JOB18_027558 [Solea senegalensis]